MFPVLQYPNLRLPSCPFCVAGDSECDSDFPLWVGFPHYLISPPAPWMDFSISWHAGNFLLASRQPHRANSLVLSLLVMGRFWCLPEDSFAVKNKNRKQTLRHQMPFCMYIDLFLIQSCNFSPNHLGIPAREQDSLTVRTKHVLHSRNHDSAWFLGGLYCWYIGGPKKCHFPTRLP